MSNYLVEALWWIALLAVLGKIVGLLLAWPRKENKP